MILKGEIFKTASGRPKQRGRNDTFRLVPESQEELERLEQLARHGRLTYFRGSAYRERSLNDLGNTARAIDPEFRTDIRIITASFGAANGVVGSSCWRRASCQGYPYGDCRKHGSSHYPANGPADDRTAQTPDPRARGDIHGECLIFTAFPFDVIICAEFGTHADVIRDKLWRQLFRALQYVLDTLPEEHVAQFDAHVEARFSDYAKAWASAQGGQGLERIGRVAAQAIYGEDVVGVTSMVACSVQAAATFKSFKGIGTKYEVVAESA